MEQSSWKKQQEKNTSFCLICSVRLKRKVNTNVSTSRRSITRVLCDLLGLLDNFNFDDINNESKPFLFCKRCCAKIRQMSKVYTKINSLHDKFYELQKEVQATV